MGVLSRYLKPPEASKTQAYKFCPVTAYHLSVTLCYLLLVP